MKISVVGSINMDLTVTAPRLPLRGETILGERLDYFPGGKGANQAFALGRLGAEVCFYGCVGRDDFGRQLIDNLSAGGVNTEHIRQLDGIKTGVALITVGQADHDNTIVVVAGANGHVDRDYIEAIKMDLLQSGLVLMQLEIPLDTVFYVAEICRKANIPVLLNPAPATKLPKSLLDQVTWLTPNEHEAKRVYDYEGPIETLLRQYPEKLVVTLGEAGCAAAESNGKILRIPAIKANVVDTTGAGDTFNAAFAFAISKGSSLRDAMAFANTAAGISTEKMGAQNGMPTHDEVLSRLISSKEG